MKTTVLVLVSSIIVFIFLEFGLRLQGGFKTYSEQNFGVYQSAYSSEKVNNLYVWLPNDSIHSQQEEFNYHYTTNELGLLKKHLLDSCKTENTIVYFGDSFTFGVGAPQDSSLPALLENKIPFKIINAGIPGSDPFFQKQLFDTIFEQKGFKKAIFMLNVSDIYDFVIRGGEERFLTNGKIAYRNAPWFEPIYQYSFIFRAIIHKIFHYDYSFLPPAKMKELKNEAVIAYSKLFIDLSQKMDLLVVLQPYPKQYTIQSKEFSEVLNYKYLEDLEILLKENEIKTLNLKTDLEKYINEETYLNYSWNIDGHYNANGYKLLSELIYKDLIEVYPEFIEK